MDLTFDFCPHFEREKKEVVSSILRWAESGRSEPMDFSGFECIVAVQSMERIVTAENKPFRDLFMGGRSALGWNADSLLSVDAQRTWQNADQMILDGACYLELKHEASFLDGRRGTLITYRRRLDELHDPSYKLLLVSRIVAFSDASLTKKKRSLNELFSQLQQLDANDQLICRHYAMGDPTKEIAKRVGLTSRSVEMRRQKILTAFGFERPVEIIKMMVRLEEHGMI
jgi:AraC-like DNA-binding protein